MNGTSIVRKTAIPETSTYDHIELAEYSLILADGIAAETFADNTDRMGVGNREEDRAMFGDTVEIVEMAWLPCRIGSPGAGGRSRAHCCPVRRRGGSGRLIVLT